MIRPSPVLAGLPPYPFVALDEARARLRAAGVDVIDFGIGEPREETPAFIRTALAEALTPVSTYPLAAGLPELRAAIAGWCERRFGVSLDPDTEIIPTLGSKEAIFHLAQVLGGEMVVVTTPGYPVPDRGARFAGKGVVALPLRAEAGFLPDLEGVDWSGVGILWLNSPNNPTGAIAPLAFLERAAALAREHGFVLAADEAYSELWFGAEPPPSALQVSELANVCVFNTLSKRSSMPGYRSGFVAGDRSLIALLKRYRPNVGTAPPEFVQRASVAAWSDEAHVDAVRARYGAKRAVMLGALTAVGLRHAGGEGSFFLWLADAEEAAARLLEEGIVLMPGSLLGAPGYARLALVPTLEACERAAGRIAAALAAHP